MDTLDHLLDRNLAWAKRKANADATYFQRMAEQQSPHYLWIGCSDSRVTANSVMGLDPGEVFVHRNIANMVHTSDLNLLSVIEYALEVLNIRHIILCGHYGCGGIQRALTGAHSALVDHWLQPIAMLYRKHRAVFDAMADEQRHARLCEINVEMQVRRLAATPLVEAAWARGQPVMLHGWIYAIHDGLLRDLGPHLDSAAERDALPSIDSRVSQAVDPPTAARRNALHAFSAMAPDPAGACACGELAATQAGE